MGSTGRSMHSLAKRPRGRAALVAAVLLGALGASAGMAHGAPAAGTAKSAAARQIGCTATARPAGTAAVRSPDAAATATDYRFSLDGSTVSQRVAPQGWSPLHASAATLRAYGFPPRPSGGVALANWTQAAAALRSAAPVGMCETDRYNTVTHTASSQNWAGGMTINGTTSTNTFWDATMRWTEPTFSSGCGTSGYSVWSGMGGWNEHSGQWRLIQAGTDVGSSLNSVHAWWEMITQDTGNPEVAFTGSSINHGDTVYADSYYISGTAYFFVEDETTGNYWSTSESSYKGHSASYYYDGSTADAITEAPSNSSGIMNLRKTTSTPIPYFTINEKSLSSWSSWRINQVRSATVQSTTFDGAHGWSDTWHRCS